MSDKLAQVVWKARSSREVVTGNGSTYQQGLDLKLPMTLAALAVTAAAGLATAAPGGAAVDLCIADRHDGDAQPRTGSLIV
jgi:hypothetical protein